ncbi:amino acid adenylation domain-containing protein [Pendulispora rubella]|uniref:Amino acid adenylation domain-containing protein n=1 Tax=Pendulispora rubella TaxID=2741070 RepID=A0ABZ2LBY6_9BACT
MNDHKPVQDSAARRALLERRLKGKAPAVASIRISRGESTEPAPLSFAQQGLWFLEQLEPGRPTYNIADFLRVHGKLDALAFERALMQVVGRHDILRTALVTENGTASQKVLPHVHLPFERIDLRGIAREQREVAMRERALEHAREPFDLARPPLLRAALVTLDESDYVILLTAHHIVTDGWSTGVLVQEIVALYSAALEGQELRLPPLQLQYADYARWQRAPERERVYEEQLTYWRQQLSGAPAVLELPTDRPRPPAQSAAGAMHDIAIPVDLSDRLRALARREGATLFMVLLAAWKAFLAHVSGQEDIVVGTPVAGRTHRELESLIGFFVNTLPLRTAVSGDIGFRQLVSRVRETALGAYAHQDIPFERLVEALRPERALRHTPIFQVLFVLQNAPLRGLALPGASLDPLLIHNGAAHFDLVLSLDDAEPAVRGSLEYATELFDGETIAHMVAQFQRLLGAVVEAPDTPLSQLDLLDAAQRHRLLVEWAGERFGPQPHSTVVAWVESTVQRAPDAVAARLGGETLTYRELHARAHGLAEILAARGVGPDVVVGLVVERSFEMLIGMLAILRAGGAYLPIDSTYPTARIRFMLEETRAPVVLASSEVAGAVPSEWHDRLLRLDGSFLDAARGAVLGPKAANLAYVMYTSGSTGQPKGVALSHGALCNLLAWQTRTSMASAGTRTLQFASPSFDVSFQEIFSTWATAGTLVLVTEEQRTDAVALHELLESEQVERLFVPVVALRHLAQVARGLARALVLREIICAGEQLRVTDEMREFLHRVPGCRLLNHYGPTETHVATWWEQSGSVDDISAVPPIGRALHDTSVYLLDRHLKLVGVGVPGEVYLSGPGLARGYYDRPGLTAERFLPDPLGPPGSRMYRTGDLARFRPDGNLDYLGRVDQQVKIRGFRVELAEVEAVLAAYPGIRECAVSDKADPTTGGKRLVAYVVPRTDDLSIRELRAFAAARLPDFMLPSAFVTLAALPLSPNKKVDRRALPDPDPLAIPEEDDVAPKSPLELLLMRLFSQVLGVPRIGTSSSFFALGGHSLLATQLVARIRDATGRAVPIKALFEHPSVGELAGALERLPRSNLPPLRSVDRDAPLALSFAQQRLWFLDQLETDNPFYNMGLAVRLTGPLDVDALEAALGALVLRHESLRTRLQTVDGEPHPIIDASIPVTLERAWLSAVAPELRESALHAQLREWADRPFELARGPLFRASLCEVGSGEHVLVLSIHHAAADGWSLEILRRELAQLYHARGDAESAKLSPLPFQYVDYAAWQRQVAEGEAFEESLRYWKEQLAGSLPVLELPSDRARPARKRYVGGTTSRPLPVSLHAALQQSSTRTGVTPFMVLLAAFDALMFRLSGQSDFAVGSPISGRNLAEFEGLIGCFVNTLVLRTTVAPHESFETLLARVKATSLSAYAHQDVPFERLVDAVNPERSTSHTPLFQVMLVHHETAPLEVFSDLRASPVQIEAGTSTFDLTLTVFTGKDRFELDCEYDSDLFDKETVDGWLAAFEVMLTDALGDPSRRIDQLRMLDDAGHRQLLAWNRSPLEVPHTARLESLIAAVAERTPDAPAVVTLAESVSYRELERGANRMARLLVEHGVSHGSRVAICLPRTPELLMVLLGVLKAGAAYVPIDPRFPANRVKWMLEDSAPAVALTVSEFAPLMPDGVPTVLLDRSDVLGASSPYDAGPIQTSGDAGAPCYVLYTSGSTGLPKGVVVSHKAVVNVLHAMAHTLELTAADRWLATTTLSFDISVPELYLPLILGGQVLLLEHVGSDPALLERAMKTLGPTIFQATPTAWRMYLDMGFSGVPGLKVLSGGESLPMDLAVRLLEVGGELWNMYGPTETAVWSSASRVRAGDDRIGLGRPLANNTLYVLGPDLEMLPPAVIGELYIGGDGVALGYFGRPGLTAERFLPDPFSASPGARMYRTGDRVRHRRSGEIEWLGRVDFQLKIRGVRVEPGEVESALRQAPGVKDVVVSVETDAHGVRHLVAFVVPAGLPIPDAVLREWLGQTLPAFLLPTAFASLPALPTTPNGKIDRTKLPSLLTSTDEGDGALAEEGDPESRLLAIWRAALGRPTLDVDTNLFGAGADSLAVARAVARGREAGMLFGVRDAFEHPNVRALARVARRSAAEPRVLPAAADGGARDLSLTPMQRGLLFHATSSPQAHEYVEQYLYRLTRAVAPDVLEQAWSVVQARHEVLRARMAWHDREGVIFHVPEESGVQIAWNDDDRPMAAICEDDLASPLDYERGPLFRLRALRRSNGEVWLLWTLHHAILDGSSAATVLSEVARLCEAWSSGQNVHLPPAYPYSEFVTWQSAYDLSAARAYFRARLPDGRIGGRLFGSTEPLRVRPEGATYGQVSASLGRERSAALAQLAASANLTLATLFQGLWGVLLARHSGEERVTFGTLVSGRSCPLPAMDERVGLFINTLPATISLRDAGSALEWFSQLQAELLALREFEGVPLASIHGWLGGVAGQLPFESVFVFDPEARPGTDPSRALFELLRPPVPRTGYPLHVAVYPGQAIELVLTFDEASFSSDRLNALLARGLVFIDALLAEPRAPLSELTMLPSEELEQVVRGFNATEFAGALACVHDLISAQAARAPDAVALVFEGEVLSYAQLDAHSDAVADRLLAVGVEPDDRVALFFERSLEMVVAILGVLKAGAAYLPLDTAHPIARSRAILEEARPRVLLTSTLLAPRLQSLEIGLLELDVSGPPPPRQNATLPKVSVQNLAYVLYTSGSTGTPKGSLLEHGGLHNRLRWMQSRFHLTPRDRVLQKTPYTFDVSVWEFLWPLMMGARLVLARPDGHRDPGYLRALIEREGITIVHFVPSMLRSFLDGHGQQGPKLASLRAVVCSGEALSGDLQARFFEQMDAPLYNLYGPTEASIDVSAWECRRSDGTNAVPIGRPIDNTELYIVDPFMNPVPVGVPGELLIGGVQLARGYIARPGLTSAQFVPDPFSGRAGARLYRTGDLARFREDGAIEFLGRRDQQVKLRGLRVELAEIEAVLRSHPSVRDCVLVAHEHAPGDVRLVAYVAQASGQHLPQSGDVG